MKKLLCAILAAALLPGALVGCSVKTEEQALSEKPALYLYPEDVTEITIDLRLNGRLTASYPAYGDGWAVTAQLDGTLHDAAGNEYDYLFWEGALDADYDFSKGFCVSGVDTADFLRQTLAEIGLTPREYNDLIVYWLPRMQNNAYNLIAFQSEAYTDAAELTIEPAPDSLLRVFMAWKPVQAPVEIEPQSFPAFVRDGFTAVEWGGVKV